MLRSMSTPVAVDASVRPSGIESENLPLRSRKIDIFFAIVFAAFTITSVISDLLPTVGVDFSHPSGNFFVNSNYWYAHDADPLFMNPPDWMRIVTGLSAFVYMPFYVVLVFSLLRAKNWIQLPSFTYAAMIFSITAIIVFGVEFWGDPAFRTHNTVKFLVFNLPYVLVPLLLLIRMRKPSPFTRRF
jgi:EXPERA (EXPanded EBP superfamily)